MIPNPSPNQEYTSVPDGDYDSDDEKTVALKKKVKFMDEKLGALEKSLSQLSQLSLDISGEIELQGGYMDSIEDTLEDNEDVEADLIQRTMEMNRQHYRNVIYFILLMILIVVSILYIIIYLKKRYNY
jgi:t-SNARE complex subunit (syntaxin)